MRTWLANFVSRTCRYAQTRATTVASILAVVILGASAGLAQPAPEASGEAGLKLPDLSSVSFLGIDAVSYTHLDVYKRQGAALRY